MQLVSTNVYLNDSSRLTLVHAKNLLRSLIQVHHSVDGYAHENQQFPSNQKPGLSLLLVEQHQEFARRPGIGNEYRF